MPKKNIILSKTFDFSLKIVELYRSLVLKKEFVLSRQLLRSGTSIGANVEEAVAAYSRREFIHKMAIASKEARETRYWIRLLRESKLVEMELDHYLEEVEEIVRILTAIIKTSQKLD